jgi:hypothetical protein
MVVVRQKKNVALVKRVVPSKPATWQYGFAISWSQRLRLPPKVTSH